MAEHRVPKGNIIYIIPTDELFIKYKNNEASTGFLLFVCLILLQRKILIGRWKLLQKRKRWIALVQSS